MMDDPIINELDLAGNAGDFREELKKADVVNRFENLAPESLEKMRALATLAEKETNEQRKESYISQGNAELLSASFQALTEVISGIVSEEIDFSFDLNVLLPDDSATDEETPIEEETSLVPIGSTPFLYFFKQELNSGFRREISDGNHNTKTTYTQIADGTSKIERKTRNSKGNLRGKYNVFTIIVSESLLNKSTKARRAGENSGKILSYLLRETAFQGIPKKLVIDLDKAANYLGYSDRNAAYKEIRKFFLLQRELVMGATEYIPGQKQPENMEEGILFYHHKRNGKYYELSLNENFNEFFFFRFYAYMPKWIFKLTGRAFSLAEYIFLSARQQTAAIKKNNGVFNLSFSAIQRQLGLPDVEEVERQNRNYKGRIYDPIDHAIEEIESAISENSKPGEFNFTITPKIPGMDGAMADRQPAMRWIRDGVLEIRLSEDYTNQLIEIQNTKENKIEKAEKIKDREMAKIQAHIEINANKANKEKSDENKEKSVAN